MAPSRARDEKVSTCGFKALKYIMFLSSILTMICGVVMLVCAANAYMLREELPALMHSILYPYIIYTMFGVSTILVFGSCLCFGASSSRCVAVLYITTIIILLLVEVLLAYVIFYEGKEVHTKITMNFEHDVRTEYGYTPEITKSIDTIQIEGKCCGARGFDDYIKDPLGDEEDIEYTENGIRRNRKQYVPDSCCRNVAKGCGINDHPSNVYYMGCEYYLLSTVESHFKTLLTICLGAICIQMLSLLITCSLCCRMGKQTHSRLSKQPSPMEMSLFD